MSDKKLTDVELPDSVRVVLEADYNEYKGRVNLLHGTMALMDEHADTMMTRLRSNAIRLGKDCGLDVEESMALLENCDDYITMKIAIENLDQIRRITRKTFRLMRFGIGEVQGTPICKEVEFERYERECENKTTDYAERYEALMIELVQCNATCPEQAERISRLGIALERIERKAREAGGEVLKNLLTEKGSWDIY